MKRLHNKKIFCTWYICIFVRIFSLKEMHSLNILVLTLFKGDTRYVFWISKFKGGNLKRENGKILFFVFFFFYGRKRVFLFYSFFNTDPDLGQKYDKFWNINVQFLGYFLQLCSALENCLYIKKIILKNTNFSTECSLNIVFFFLKFCDFSELCQFCCSAGVLPALFVYTHWHRGRTEKGQSPEYFKIFGENTIFNEHPVPKGDRLTSGHSGGRGEL